MTLKRGVARLPRRNPPDPCIARRPVGGRYEPQGVYIKDSLPVRKNPIPACCTVDEHWETGWTGNCTGWRRLVISAFGASKSRTRWPRHSTLYRSLITLPPAGYSGAARQHGDREIGMVGQAYRKGLSALTLKPDTASLGDGTLRRHATHEVHHCIRMGAMAAHSARRWSAKDWLATSPVGCSAIPRNRRNVP